MIKVILADDHELVRTGLRRLLDDQEDIKVVGEAENGLAALAVVEQFKPDVAILDINMPGLNGIEATEKLRKRYPRLKILIVSMHNDQLFPQRVFAAGANAYLTKDTSFCEIVHAISEVMACKQYICSEVAQKLALSNLSGEEPSPFSQLSEREFQVLGLILRGLKIVDISEQLFLSPKTISTYRHRLFSKLDVQNEIELAKLAMQHGFIEEKPLP